MGDKIQGYLEVGRNEKFEIVVNHPDLKPDANGVGHIVFSPKQARDLVNLLLRNANEIELGNANFYEIELELKRVVDKGRK